MVQIQMEVGTSLVQAPLKIPCIPTLFNRIRVDLHLFSYLAKLSLLLLQREGYGDVRVSWDSLLAHVSQPFVLMKQARAQLDIHSPGGGCRAAS